MLAMTFVWWLVAGLSALAALALGIWIMVVFLRYAFMDRDLRAAFDALDERLARGEISEAEYERRRWVLRGRAATRPAARHHAG